MFKACTEEEEEEFASTRPVGFAAGKNIVPLWPLRNYPQIMLNNGYNVWFCTKGGRGVSSICPPLFLLLISDGSPTTRVAVKELDESGLKNQQKGF